MILLLSIVVAVALILATPWRGRSRGEHLWLTIGALNTFVCFGVPTVAATSPWRSILDVVTGVNYAVSILLTVVGGVLWFRSIGPARAPRRWIAGLVLCALPFLLWSAVGILWTVASRR